MSKATFPATGPSRERMGFMDVDVQLITREMQEAGPLAKMKELMPDDWKAYLQFRVNHSLPVVAGPLASGNFSGYHPRVIAKSHPSLINQQVNLNHKIHSYDPENVPEDRIVGCVIATQFPMGDHSRLPADRASAPCITGIAAIFKQAKGVDKMLGGHLASRKPWSLSLEVAFQIEEAGIWFPDEQRMVAVRALPEDVWRQSVQRRGGRNLYGKYKGQQLVLCPGGEENPVAYQGFGLTTNPAELEAGIDQIKAEKMDLGEGMMALCAEAQPLALFRRGVSWPGPQSRTIAKVEKVFHDGTAVLGQDRRTATPENPVLQVMTLGGLRLLRTLASVQVG